MVKQDSIKSRLRGSFLRPRFISCSVDVFPGREFRFGERMFAPSDRKKTLRFSLRFRTTRMKNPARRFRFFLSVSGSFPKCISRAVERRFGDRIRPSSGDLYFAAQRPIMFLMFGRTAVFRLVSALFAFAGHQADRLIEHRNSSPSIPCAPVDCWNACAVFPSTNRFEKFRRNRGSAVGFSRRLASTCARFRHPMLFGRRAIPPAPWPA